MKFFLDTANIDEIKDANSMGMVDGVTTNPSLIAKEGRDFEEVIKEICEIVDGPISAEVISTDSEGMLKEARHLAGLHKNIVVKIPMTVDGIKATCQLTKEGIKTNVTLVFSPLQALMAAKAGATYVSPFLGRLEDLSETGLQPSLAGQKAIKKICNRRSRKQECGNQAREPIGKKHQDYNHRDRSHPIHGQGVRVGGQLFKFLSF